MQRRYTKNIMEEVKPKSIKIVGMIIIGLSIFAIFGNGLGSLALSSGGFFEQNSSLTDTRTGLDNSGYYLFFNYMLKFGLAMVLFGLLFLVGGIFLTKHKNWARVSLITLSSIFILGQIFILIIILSLVFNKSIYFLSSIGIIVAIVFFIAISFSLVIFLNKKQIKKHFV